MFCIRICFPFSLHIIKLLFVIKVSRHHINKIIELHHAFYLQIPTCYSHDIIFFLQLHPPNFSTLPFDFPYVLIKNALSMYGRPVQLYVSILILETVSPILHATSHSLMVCRSVSMVCVFCSFSINRSVYNNISFTHLLR